MGGEHVATDELDPFERFNRAMGQGVVTNPYPDFGLLRAQHIVPANLAGVPAEQAAGLPRIFTAASYDAVYEVLRDGARFSSAGYGEVMGPVMGRTILQMDEPEHHSYRSLIQQAFSRPAMQRWESEVVRPIIDGLIEQILAGGEARADLVRQLTFPFPLDVIAELFGLPRESQPTFHRLAVELISVSVDLDLAQRASAELAELLLPMIDARRNAPTGDLISLLAHAQHDGQRLTDDEILAFCRLLLPAGAETTYRSTSNLLVGLLTHPEQLDAVRADRSLLPQAIEEGLRWEAPLLTILRTATSDTEVCGVPVPAGAVVVLNLGAANHDDRRWQEPERFDIFREAQPHVSFAWGPHLCVGLHLSRMETRIALERLFDCLPDMRLDPEAEPPVITGLTFRSPASIPVVWS